MIDNYTVMRDALLIAAQSQLCNSPDEIVKIASTFARVLEQASESRTRVHPAEGVLSPAQVSAYLSATEPRKYNSDGTYQSSYQAKQALDD